MRRRRSALARRSQWRRSAACTGWHFSPLSRSLHSSGNRLRSGAHGVNVERMDLLCPRLPRIALWFTLGTISLFGQTAAVIASGYALPVTQAAPGEVVTITAAGLERITPDYIRAAKLPLPLTLGGVSVTLHQTAALPADLAVPLLGIDQWDDCGKYDFDTGPNCVMTGITLQIPYEMAQFHPDLAGTVDRAWLVVHQNGKDAVPFRITAVMNHVHVLTECDRFFFPWLGRRPTISPCPAIVAHGDGSQVTEIVPARPGEELIIYAVGLGLPNQAVQSGDVSPSPAATVDRVFYLQYCFRPNATPIISYVDPFGSDELSQPTFVGLTPGQVGLYQINVRLPDTFPQVAQCGTIPNSSRSITSNLTITVSAAYGGGSETAVVSFDGAAICVQPE